MSDSELRQSERKWHGDNSKYAERRFLLGRIRAGQIDEERLSAAATLGHVVAQSLVNVSISTELEHRDQLQKGLALLGPREAIAFAHDCINNLLAGTDHAFTISPGPEAALSWVQDWLNGKSFKQDQAQLFINASRQISQMLTAQAQAFSWLQESVVLGQKLQLSAAVIQASSQLVAAVCAALDLPGQELTVHERVLEAVNLSQIAINRSEDRLAQKARLANILLGLQHQFNQGGSDFTIGKDSRESH
ncbi:MAG: hypothetical protein P1V97_20530 [Planctomycetota bacterium]|nr:hypothetical protein [Planctomycetota bacterium]